MTRVGRIAPRPRAAATRIPSRLASGRHRMSAKITHWLFGILLPTRSLSGCKKARTMASTTKLSSTVGSRAERNALLMSRVRFHACRWDRCQIKP